MSVCPISDLSKSIAAKRNANVKTLQKPQPRAPAPRQQPKEKEDLPACPEIEKAVLSVMLQAPDKGFPIFERGCRHGFFSNPVNRELYTQAKQFYEANGRIDLIGFTAHLGDSGKLAALGGPGYITEIWIQNCPIDALDYYLKQLRITYIRRQIIVRSFALTSKAKVEDVEGLLADMARSAQDLKDAAGGLNGNAPTQITPYLTSDPKHDPDCLVGNRWIVRGGSTLWGGMPGIGKSSLIMQLVLYWAKGETIFGLRPTRPLRSIIIQAENDFLDVSEQIQGIASALNQVDGFSVADLSERIWIAQCNGITGHKFLAYLDMILSTYKTDLVWIDPLFAYAGCDLMNAKETGLFLREGLFPLALKHGVSVQVAHHVPKRITNPGETSGAEIDFQFLGFGTSEIQNAFRAVNIIVPVPNEINRYKLVLSKRGERAGARDVEDKFTRALYLSHCDTGICWLQADEPETEKKSMRYNENHIKDVLSVAKGWKTAALQKHLAGEIGMSKATFYRLWEQLKNDGKVKCSEGLWFKN